MPPESKKIDKCRLTGSDLLPVFDLGTPCVSDFVPPGTPGVPAPLCVAVAKEVPYLAQLTHSYPPEAMYRRYHYRSGTNEAMRAELADVVAKARRLRPVKAGETVLDIACNDGTLLLNWMNEYGTSPFNLVGVDPSDVAWAANHDSEGTPLGAIVFVNDFFSQEAYRRATDKPAAVVTCVAMFYDLDDPVGFLKDVRAVMADDGLFVLQVAYIPMHVRMGAWDYIGHEHLTAWDYSALSHALALAGFLVVDVEVTPSNGGSIRVYAMPTEAAIRRFDTPESETGREHVRQMRSYEDPVPACGRRPRQLAAYANESIDLAWRRLGYKARRDRQELTTFLRQCLDDKKTVVGYGASTKGNSILQYCGITPDLLPCIADRQNQKVGLVTAGSGIPIISEDECRKMKPDYLLVLPWFFAQAMQEREKDLLQSGTKMVLPLPKLTVLP